MVERGELALTQPLGNSEDGSVNVTDTQVGVSLEELSHPHVVRRRQVFYAKTTTGDLVDHSGKRADADGMAQAVLELHQDRRWNAQPFVCFAKKRGAALVLLVAPVDRRRSAARCRRPAPC